MADGKNDIENDGLLNSVLQRVIREGLKNAFEDVPKGRNDGATEFVADIYGSTEAYGRAKGKRDGRRGGASALRSKFDSDDEGHGAEDAMRLCDLGYNWRLGRPNKLRI